MKKLFIFLILNLFLINYSLANVPSLGLANYGFVCNAEKGPAKAKKGVKNLGFVDEEGLFFYLMYIEEDNEFAIIENSPLQLGDISDNKYKLKDVIIWYDFFMMGDSIMPIFSPKTFFYDDNKKNYYLIDNIFKLEKKFHKKVKRHDKILMRQFVGPVRKKIGKRTIFNMIGPLSNPALVDRQVVGVFDKKLLKIFAEGLKNLKIRFAWIVNSEDGLDEISPYEKTNVIQLKDGKISEITIDPKSLNVNAEKFENLIGDDANFNANKMIEIFKGKDNDFSKAVCLNAAAGLIVSEKFTEFSEAYNFSREFILSGKPYLHLEKIQNV